MSAGTGAHQSDSPGVDGRKGRGALEERVRFSKRRQTIAKRLVEARQLGTVFVGRNLNAVPPGRVVRDVVIVDEPTGRNTEVAFDV